MLDNEGVARVVWLGMVGSAVGERRGCVRRSWFRRSVGRGDSVDM